MKKQIIFYLSLALLFGGVLAKKFLLGDVASYILLGLGVLGMLLHFLLDRGIIAKTS